MPKNILSNDPILNPTLHRRPKVVRIKELREFPVHIDNMNISLVFVSNDSLGVLSLLVPVHVNTQASVNLQLEADLIVH